jgi:mycothiol synthase
MLVQKILSRDSLLDEFDIRPAALDDLEDTVQLVNLCSLERIGKLETDVDRTRKDWETPGFDLAQSTRVVHTLDGQLVGFAAVWDLNAIPVNPWVWGRVHPAYEGQGIGSWLLEWTEERARQVISRVPEDARVTMSSETVSTYEPAKKLFESKDMQNVRQFWEMLIELDGPIPVPSWPASISLKTYEELPELRRIHRAIDEAFQDHWGYVDQPTEESLARWRHHIESDETFDPTLWFLAMDGDEIAGVSLCDSRTPEDAKMGWVDVLGVRRPWRRQGVALALLHHSFSEFKLRGQNRVGLGVDSASLTGATRLYSRAGMHVYRRFDTYEKVLRAGRDLRKRALE